MDEPGNESDDSDESHEELVCTGTNVPLTTTSRLILRAPRVEDAAAIAKIANNRKIAEQTRRLPYPYNNSDVLGWMEAMAAAQECAFLITRKSDRAIIGVASSFVTGDEQTEIGYWIGEPYWGNGFATEAVHAVIDYTFAERELEQLLGHCRVSNAASRRVLMKCGFQLTGSGMSDSRTLQGLVPVEEYVLERSVWESLKRWGAAG